MPRYPLEISSPQTMTQWRSINSPFSGKLVGEVEIANGAIVEQALTLAYERFHNKKMWLSAADRISILEKTASLMQENFDELVTLAVSEGGKPLVDTKVEVNRAIDGVRNCVECIRTNSGKEIPMGINTASTGRLAFSRHEPLGVVVALSAFNHPLNLIVHQVGPAIAAGCPVIVKPASDTPLSCFKFVELLREAGLPESYCIPLVTDNHDTTEQLVTDGRVGFFSFIGSANVGWKLKSQLAPGTRCALEHGGVAPVIIAADADLERALPSIAKGGFYHAGQVCVSVQRVYVHTSILNEVVAGLTEIVTNMVVGDPTSEKTEVGPLIKATETTRISHWVGEAIEKGAKLITGGTALSDVLYSPTIILNPPENAKVTTEEIFGPVICLYTYDDVDDALTRANSLDVAFQAAVFTQDIDQTMYIQRNLNAATVMVNDHTAFRVDWMPFTGLRKSGYGVGGIPYTFEDMQVKKVLVVQSPMLI